MDGTFTLSLCCPLPRAAFDVSGPTSTDEILEMERLLDGAGDFVLFPEGFLSHGNLDRATQRVRASGRWASVGVEEADGALSVVVISPDGEIRLRHQKTALTDGDLDAGRVPGSGYQILETPFGVIGTPLCYEIHFPEISRIFSMLGAQILLNPVGTGMWHELQLSQWTTVARARAIENGVFVAGCTHCCGAIPMAYAYRPDGAELGFIRDSKERLTVTIDTGLLPPQDWKRHRTPELYHKLIEKTDN